MLIMMAWHYHYLFFRRFGLEDKITGLINSAFLFLIIFFAYPLKFLCIFLWYTIIGQDKTGLFITPENFIFNGLIQIDKPSDIIHFQRIGMMYLYSFGLIGVFGSLAILQLRAYQLREKLELDALEKTMTMNAIAHHMITVTICLISLSVLYFTNNSGLSGIVYFLMPFAHSLMGWYDRTRIKKIKTLL